MNQLKFLIVVYTSILIAQNPTNLWQLNIASSAKRTYSLLHRYFGFCLCDIFTKLRDMSQCCIFSGDFKEVLLDY